MLKIARIRILPVILLSLILLPPLTAGPAQATTETNDPDFESVQKKLIKDGFDSEEIKRLYSRPQVFFEAKGVSVFFTYSEAELDYDQFASDWSIRKAKTFMQTHEADLRRAEKAYGVESRVITAILLVETGLGTSVGKWSALNTLSTMASLQEPQTRERFWKLIPKSKRISRKKFEKKADRRAGWAYRELKAFLTYAYQQGLDPAKVPGSIAGAIGYAQFMPSNILAYGKDGNNDGNVDLLNLADSMASIAYYLKRHGWRPQISRKKAEKVIYHYNHSKYYVNIILKIADLLKG
jgi:membrane-bound lytic murein transglycosylase B